MLVNEIKAVSLAIINEKGHVVVEEREFVYENH